MSRLLSPQVSMGKMREQADKALLKEESLARKAEKRARKQKQLAAITQKQAGEQPPGFWHNPISFLFYFWYTPLLYLVSRVYIPPLIHDAMLAPNIWSVQICAPRVLDGRRGLALERATFWSTSELSALPSLFPH